MPLQFDFGSNWRAFSEKKLNLARITRMKESLQSLLPQETIVGKSFLDVGCGSGLFSIAAQKLGACPVVGIDNDPRCIAVSNENQVRFAPQAPISFHQMSVLRAEDLNLLGPFDIVYAWGSLHHTGAMWAAIYNASRRVAPGGTLVLAIYNKHFTSPLWQVIKRRYNQLPPWGQRGMILFFSGMIFFAKLLITGRNPLAKERGMDFWSDVVDWVGGYPYEYASPRTVETFVEKQGFVLRRFIAAKVPTGCNEFIFGRMESEALAGPRPS